MTDRQLHAAVAARGTVTLDYPRVTPRGPWDAVAGPGTVTLSTRGALWHWTFQEDRSYKPARAEGVEPALQSICHTLHLDLPALADVLDTLPGVLAPAYGDN